ncbi:MAG: thioredoxin family protein [Planctomycetaceae bacterium]|nr:thioredoxin family protein [Planctomycetaceae bacterium]
MRHFTTALLLSATVLTAVALFAADSGRGISWIENPQAGVTVARQSQRPMLLYFTTSWCHYCKKLDQTTWSHDAVREEIQTQFVPIKVDGDRHKDLAKSLGVRGFPTLVMLSPDGRELNRVVGYKSGPAMLTQLTSAREKSVPVTIQPTAVR